MVKVATWIFASFGLSQKKSHQLRSSGESELKNNTIQRLKVREDFGVWGRVVRGLGWAAS